MKIANTNALYPNDDVAKSVVEYAAAHSEALPARLTEYHASVVASEPRSEYLTSNLQSQFNTFFVRTTGAKRVLEIGTYVGYSAMVWSNAVGSDGYVTTLESSPEYVDAATTTFQKQAVANIKVVQGDALETLKNLEVTEPYDIVFIDAQKTGYPEYMRTVLARSQPGQETPRLLRKGGVIIADNVLRRALVANDTDQNPWTEAMQYNSPSGAGKAQDVKALREYNDLAVKSERLETCLMPIFDGVSMATLRD